MAFSVAKEPLSDYDNRDYGSGGRTMKARSKLNISGIYQISCSRNGRVYVGQAVNIQKRWTHHRWCLNNGQHDNPHLQRAWKKYGQDAFVFEVVEILEIENQIELTAALNDAEFRVLRAAKRPFNMANATDTGMRVSEETRAKLSAERKARWADPEYKARVRASMLAKAADPEYQARRGAAIREAKSRPDRAAKAGADASARWADLEFKKARGKERAANWQDPEYRAAQSSSRKAVWDDPEVRAKRSAGMKAAWVRRRAPTS